VIARFEARAGHFPESPLQDRHPGGTPLEQSGIGPCGVLRCPTARVWQMRSPTDAALLRGPAALIVAIAFCTYEALPRFLTLLGPEGISPIPKRDEVLIIGLLFSVFVAACVGFRSPFLRDRVIFGLAAGAFVLKTIRVAVLLGPGLALTIGGLESLLWIIAAITALIGLRSERRV
jgi:hypothetical protein